VTVKDPETTRPVLMNDDQTTLLLSVFPTSLGWFGLLGDGQSVHGVEIGYPSASSIRRRIGSASARESDWNPELRSRLEDFAAGQPTDFDDVELALPPLTRFRFLVMKHVRQVGYGRTTSYGEVARKIGRPGAARAVGSAMANNPVPILVPCHRVIAASGRLGGFSAPQGTQLKRQLLEMEAAASG